MKEARKARETSSLGRKPRFRWSQLIQSVLMTKTTTDVREKSTVLHRDKRRIGRKDAGGQEGIGRVGIRRDEKEESINEGRGIKIEKISLEDRH